MDQTLALDPMVQTHRPLVRNPAQDPNQDPTDLPLLDPTQDLDHNRMDLARRAPTLVLDPSLMDPSRHPNPRGQAGRSLEAT